MATKKVTATFSFYCKGEETKEYVEAYMKALLERFKEIDLPEHIDLDNIEVEDE